MRQNIKNYTSEAKVENTVQKIEELVVKKMHARQFFKEYKNGEIHGIIFVIPTDKGDLPFKMPSRVEKLEKILKPDQARRTAWKNIYDWIDAQIALIETEQVKVEEVMLPYLTTPEGVTLFEIMEKNKFALPSGVQEGEVL